MPAQRERSVTGAGHGNGAKRYQRLKAWAACHALLLAIYRSSAAWPKHEIYGLTAQARRAAFAAAATIAEGSAKRGEPEFRRFLDMALGSLSELSYTLLVAKELGLLTPAAHGELEALRDHANRLTWGLYRVLSGSTRQARRTGGR